jgi:predicted HTH domain antitoxin
LTSTAFHGVIFGLVLSARIITVSMASPIVDLGEALSGFLATLGQSPGQTAREMIVFELYRRGLVSSGKAAELLGTPRIEFIQRASELGIPYFRFIEDEWHAEVAESKQA